MFCVIIWFGLYGDLLSLVECLPDYSHGEVPLGLRACQTAGRVSRRWSAVDGDTVLVCLLPYDRWHQIVSHFRNIQGALNLWWSPHSTLDGQSFLSSVGFESSHNMLATNNTMSIHYVHLVAWWTNRIFSAHLECWQWLVYPSLLPLPSETRPLPSGNGIFEHLPQLHVRSQLWHPSVQEVCYLLSPLPLCCL